MAQFIVSIKGEFNTDVKLQNTLLYHCKTCNKCYEICNIVVFTSVTPALTVIFERFFIR